MIFERMGKSTCNLAVWAAVMALLTLASCRSTKHVPDGQLLLDKTTINITDTKQHPDVAATDLVNYLRQTENHKVLGGMKLQLAIYNLSGRDSSRWFNRWIRRIGSPPVIYDSTLTLASVNQLRTALKNRGFFHNQVDYTFAGDTARKKARVEYNITLGEPYHIRSVKFNIDNDSIRPYLLADSAREPIAVGSVLDLTKLEAWRTTVTERLRRAGYYAFGKEYITFDADTAAASNEVDLTINTRAPYRIERMPYYDEHKPFYVRNVTYVTNFDPVAMRDGYFAADSTTYGGIRILYDEPYLRPKAIEECNFITAGARYDIEDVDRTYKALSRLGILKFINIELRPVGEINGQLWLDAYVLLTRGKAQAVSVSLEGTNSEGDLGFGVGLDWQHRNLFRGSETLNTKFRMSYQSLSGNLNGLINNNYSEYAAEVGLNFPKFKAPLLSKNFKRKVQASTELAINFNYQQRPEYTRVIAGAAWRYIWSERQATLRHTLNLVDLSYVYLPRSRANFLDSIANPLLRYSYENHFIMRLGYNFYKTNKRVNNPLQNRLQPNVYTIRAAAETAGNVLYGISKLTAQSHAQNDNYKIFGIRYAQYIKFEADYSLTHNFDTRNSIAFRVGAGVAVPYGNSTVLPFEKRFYAGGANGVRGWGVRTLGPGEFSATNSQSKFIYQCGDIRFDANIEYRAKLFWVIELGLFIDAGNIWTIRDYEDQPGGVFKFNKFYKQIALAYGLGIRLDFNYFLVRLDMGMKAHNPAAGQEPWPLTHPKFKRDSEFHFSVGYPF